MRLRNLGRNGLKIIQNWWRVILAITVLIILIWVGYVRLATGIVVLAIVVLILMGILIWVVYERLATGKWPDWTGFGEYISPAVPQTQTFQRQKTLWDWMQLLIVPAVLASGAYWLNESTHQSDQAIANNNIREAALQTYIDRMAELLIKENLSESKNGSEVRVVARAQTLTVLGRLDKDRKRSLLLFLYEADLIQKGKRVIYLRGADLSEADLSGADLSGADLSYARLNEADLTAAYLNSTNLSWTDLRRAKLINAILSGADLSGADLSGADLFGANLSEAKYTKNAKHFRDTIWPEGFDPDAAGAMRVND